MHCLLTSHIICTENQSPWKADAPCPHPLLPQSDVESRSKLLESSQSSQPQPISQQLYQYQQSCEQSSRYSSHQPQFEGKLHIFSKSLMCFVSWRTSISLHTKVWKFGLTFWFPGTSKPTQKQLMEQLYQTVADKWQPIGSYLEIPQAQLSAISERCHGDPQKCLMAVLTEKWLPRVSPPPTWQELAAAIEFIGRPDVAKILRQLYCKYQVISDCIGQHIVYNCAFLILHSHNFYS